MATAEEELVREDDAELLAEVERLGGELRTNRARQAELREQLYPVLYVANAKRGISLGRLQKMTGLTRGRIHQVVHLVDDAQKTQKAKPEPEVQEDRPAATGWSL